jgi:hypothetical protein
MACDEGAAGQVKHQTPIHLFVEVEVEAVERLVRVTKPSLLFSPLQQAIATTIQFVGDQAGEEVNRGHGFGLGLLQTGFRWKAFSWRTAIEVCVVVRGETRADARNIAETMKR